MIFDQHVKTKSKKVTMTLIKAEDFFRVIKEKGIRSNFLAHDNLQEFLKLDQKNPGLLRVKKIKMTLLKISENEEYID